MNIFLMTFFVSAQQRPPLARGLSDRARNENTRLKVYVSFISSLASPALRRSPVSERKRGNLRASLRQLPETIFHVARKAELGG